jgi:hypothetical protein
VFDGGRRREGKIKGKEGKISPWRRRISLGLDPLHWLCSGSQLLDAVKG